MDAMMKQTIDGLLMSFDSIQINDAEMAAEVEHYKKSLYNLGEEAGDIGTFMQKLQTSGLMEKQSQLITKASMLASAAPQSSSGQTQEASKERRLPSVREFLEQYRPSYEAAKNHGFQFTAVTAYEELLGVAERTNDLLEMQIILEKEGLLQKITSTALYDISKITYDRYDPNEIFLRRQEEINMKISQSYKSLEELYYLKDRKVVYEAYKDVSKDLAIREAIATLALFIIGHDGAKRNARLDPEKYLGAFVATHLSAKKIYSAIQELWNLDWEKIVRVPRYQKMLLGMSLVGDPNKTGYRLYMGQDPQNLLWMEEILFQEILSGKTITELLLRRSERVFHPIQEGDSSPMTSKAQSVGREKISDLYWVKD